MKGLVTGFGTLFLAGAVMAAPYKSTYTPPPAPRPSYSAPSRPSYTAPSRPSYSAPSRPSYTAPSRPSYTAPSRPSYTAPSRPSYSSTPSRTQQYKAQDRAVQNRQQDNRKYDTYRAQQNQVVNDSIKKQNDNAQRWQRQEALQKATQAAPTRPTPATSTGSRWGK